jgi:hypothetical protein
LRILEQEGTMSRAPACPDASQYERLISHGLPDAETEALLVHLEGCDACAQQLGTLLERDTLASLIRQARTLEDETSEETIAGLVQRLSQLRPEGPAPAETQDESPSDYPSPPVADPELYDFLAPPQAPDELGRLGPYRVLQVLGAGGMGVVFRAEDPQLARLVALKAMLPALAASASARQRFLREGRATAAIKHDHIVTIYQVGEDRGVPYLAMELLEGEPLDARLQREGKLPPAEVLRIGREMGLGLAAAHARGLIHRDIKPPNVFLVSGEEPKSPSDHSPLTTHHSPKVKILDFGLARAAGEEGRITQQGAIVGTPAYMAPEQAQGKGVDARGDLFSLGCTLYRMATGAPPFTGTDMISTLMAVATETPRPPCEVESTLPPALSDLILKLLAKEPGDRPPSAQAVAEALERMAREPAAPGAVRRVSGKKWFLLAGVAAGILLVGLIGLAGLWLSGVFKVKTNPGTIVPEDDQRFTAGSVWMGKRTYREGWYKGATVTYELHVQERDGMKFQGHVFDNGPGRNRAEVEGEINGETLVWREQGRFPELHLNIEGKLTGDTIRLTLKGERTDGWIFTEGDGELTLRKP